jgi:perosamine synthetase
MLLIPPWPPADPEILDTLQSAFHQGTWGQYLGNHIPELEKFLSEQFQSPYVLTCSSGTLAVEIALRALKVSSGDEVILSAYDYEANFLNIHAIGAIPVLIDVSSSNCNLDPFRIEEAITPKTKAILVSHLHGGLVPMTQVMETAKRHQLPVIEDAAQAPGAIIEGRSAGSWGDVGILSFGGSKLLSAGRGGAILTPHPDVYQRAKVALSRGIQQWGALSELQAIVLKPQLAKLQERTEMRLHRVQLLVSLLIDIPGFRLFENQGVCTPAYYKVGFQFDSKTFGMDRAAFLQQMHQEEIPFDEGFRALHINRSSSRFRKGTDLTQAEKAHHGVVKLHHPVLLGNESSIQYIANCIRKAYRNANSSS